MNRICLVLLIVAGCFGLMLIGCGDQNGTDGGQSDRGANDMSISDRIKMDAMSEKVEIQLEELRKQMVLVQASVDQMSQDARDEFKQMQDQFEKTYDQATEKLSRWKTASGQAKDDIKQGLDAAITELQKAVTQASTRFTAESAEVEGQLPGQGIQN